MPRSPRSARRALVLYGTSQGHSAKVAAAVARTISAAGFTVDVVDAAADDVTTGPDDYAAVLIVASVHAGNYQGAVVDWVRRHARALNQRPSAFVSVSLGVLQDDPKVKRELGEILQRFLDKTGWTPTATKAVAGALMYSRYNLLERVLMKRIAAQAGGSTDTSRDVEYTDWTALTRFVRSFASKVGPS